MAYFKPLRRKIGVVTLVLACMLLGSWFRHQHVDRTRVIGWETESWTHEISLRRDGIRFVALLSAYLLLSKPPEVKPKFIQES